VGHVDLVIAQKKSILRNILHQIFGQLLRKSWKSKAKLSVAGAVERIGYEPGD
jgi:hypothetical protein